MATSMPLVHLELHTPDLPDARGFYAMLCGWRPHAIETAAGPYVAMDMREGVGGGIVQCPTERALWLPYVEVGEIHQALGRARALGAEVLLEPREGPSGWRSVIGTPAGGELALWHPKR
jgi:predicted enzyme related to lactoylglutathione lyase